MKSVRTQRPQQGSQEHQTCSGICSERACSLSSSPWLFGGLVSQALLDRLLQSRQHLLTLGRHLSLLSQGEGERANVGILARQRDDFRLDGLKVLVSGPCRIEERLTWLVHQRVQALQGLGNLCIKTLHIRLHF